MRRFLLSAIVWTLGLAIGAAQNPGQPLFRSSNTLVFVDVSVKNGFAPVPGLTAADFALTDNGVPQTVQSALMEGVPIDVSLVIDVSGSVVPDLGKFRDDIKKIGAMLRADDRVRLVSFGTDVQELAPMRPAKMALPVDLIKPGGATAMNDGILFGLAWPGERERRHLVVVFTDGEDTSSALDNANIPRVASRANAVLHLVLSRPHQTGVVPSREALIDAVDRTGGEVHRLDDVAMAFQRLFEDFRRSYVLYYTPAGVPRDGWHDIAVNVKDKDGYTVRARKGYFGG